MFTYTYRGTGGRERKVGSRTVRLYMYSYVCQLVCAWAFACVCVYTCVEFVCVCVCVRVRVCALIVVLRGPTAHMTLPKLQRSSCQVFVSGSHRVCQSKPTAANHNKGAAKPRMHAHKGTIQEDVKINNLQSASDDFRSPARAGRTIEWPDPRW